MIKKIKTLLACFLILAVFGSMTAFAAEPKATDKTNLETQNALTSPIDLERQTFTGIKDSILVPATEVESQPRFTHDFQGTIWGDGVRLRNAPSDTATVLELMYDGERVWIDQRYNDPNGDWYHVTRQSTGRTGYVYWEYCQPDFGR